MPYSDPNVRRTRGRDYTRKYLANDPEGIKRERRRQYSQRYMVDYRMKSFGLTVEDYARMFDQQQGLCAICGQPEMVLRRGQTRWTLAIDHDHKTGRLRALLCSQCNTGLGRFFDEAERLEAAARYLRDWSSRPAPVRENPDHEVVRARQRRHLSRLVVQRTAEALLVAS